MWSVVRFNKIYAEPSKNGLMRPKAVRGSGYKMVNMGELFAYNRINNPQMDLVSMNEVEKGKYSLKAGDLLFARQSLIASGAGKCSIVLNVPETTTFESHIIRVRLEQARAEPLFYYYYFLSPEGKGNVQSLVMQVAAAGIRASELAELFVPYPPLPTQRKIAAILSAYDDLIENNTRRIAILEEMAQALYREWFVHFRFPGSEKKSMVESILGMIPEGWEVKKIGDAVELAYGKALKADTRMIGTVPVYGSGGVVGYHNEHLVKGPGIIVGRKGNVGSIFWSDDDFFLLSQHFINNDAAVPGLNRNQAYLLPFLLPEVLVIKQFQEVVSPLFQQLNTLKTKNATLRCTRDLLLPKLIAGELDVEGMAIALGDDGVGENEGAGVREEEGVMS